MSSAVEERVKAILSVVTDIEKLNKSAMIQAAAAGLKMINDYYDELMNEMFVDTMSLYGLDSYKELFDIDLSLSDDKAKSIISSNMKQGVRLFKYNEFGLFLQSLKRESEYFSKSFITMISGITFSQIELLPMLAKKLDELAPPVGKIIFSKNGVNYDSWDSKDFTFSEYDALNSPFSIIDTI